MNAHKATHDGQYGTHPLLGSWQGWREADVEAPPWAHTRDLPQRLAVLDHGEGPKQGARHQPTDLW